MLPLTPERQYPRAAAECLAAKIQHVQKNPRRVGWIRGEQIDYREHARLNEEQDREDAHVRQQVVRQWRLNPRSPRSVPHHPDRKYSCRVANPEKCGFESRRPSVRLKSDPRDEGTNAYHDGGSNVRVLQRSAMLLNLPVRLECGQHECEQQGGRQPDPAGVISLLAHSEQDRATEEGENQVGREAREFSKQAQLRNAEDQNRLEALETGPGGQFDWAHPNECTTTSNRRVDSRPARDYRQSPHPGFGCQEQRLPRVQPQERTASVLFSQLVAPFATLYCPIFERMGVEYL